MRLARFQPYALTAIKAGPDVQAVEAWNEDGKRPYGLRVTFSTGGRVLLGITAVAAPGDNYAQTETPVEGDAPLDLPLPDLYQDGKVTPPRAELYLAALVANGGSREIAGVYGYSDREAPNMHPGLGVVFHSGAKIHMVMVHTLRRGQDRGRQYQLQEV